MLNEATKLMSQLMMTYPRNATTNKIRTKKKIKFELNSKNLHFELFPK